MRYKTVVLTKDGWGVQRYANREAFEAAMIEQGRAVSAQHPRRAAVLRAELKDAPVVDDLYGPFWGGDESDGELGPTVRYESREAYDVLST